MTHADLLSDEALEFLRTVGAQQHRRTIQEREQREIHQLAPRQGHGVSAAQDVDAPVLDRLEPVLGPDRHGSILSSPSACLTCARSAGTADRVAGRLAESVSLNENGRRPRGSRS